MSRRSSSGGRLKPCCCNLSWCLKTRKDHALGSSLIQFPWKSKEEMIEDTCAALQILDRSSIDENSRIWIGHYHHEDIEKKSNGIGYVVNVNEQTKYSYGRNNKLSKGPPIPDASLEEIGYSSERFHGVMEGQSSSNKKKKRNNDLLNTPLLEQQTSSEFKSSSNASHDVPQELFNSNKKRKKEYSTRQSNNNSGKSHETTQTDFLTSNQETQTTKPRFHKLFTCKKGTHAEKMMAKYFIVSGRKLFELINCVQSHARCCPGRFPIKTRNFSGKTLMSTFSSSCTLGANCALINNRSIYTDGKGVYKWTSSNEIEVDGKQISVVDTKFCVAAVMTRNSRRAAEVFSGLCS